MSTGRREAPAAQGRRKKRRRRHVWGYWAVILLLIAVCVGLGVQTAGSVQVTLWERRQYVSALAEKCSTVQADAEAVLAGDVDALNRLDGDLADLETLTDGSYCLWFNVLNQAHSFTENADPCASSIEGIRSRYAVIADGVAAGGTITEKGQRFLQGIADACGDFCDAVGYSAESASVSGSFADPDSFITPRNALAQSLSGLTG